MAKVGLLQGLLPQRGAWRPMNWGTLPLGLRGPAETPHGTLAVGTCSHQPRRGRLGSGPAVSSAQKAESRVGEISVSCFPDPVTAWLCGLLAPRVILCGHPRAVSPHRLPGAGEGAGLPAASSLLLSSTRLRRMAGGGQGPIHAATPTPQPPPPPASCVDGRPWFFISLRDPEEQLA